MGAGCCYDNLSYRDIIVDRIKGKRKAKAYLDAVLAGIELDDIDI